MATTIKLKRTGDENSAVTPAQATSLLYAEPAYCSKEKILYIGTEAGDGSGYGEFVAVGEDTNYLPSAHPANAVTSALVTQWNTGYTHSQAAHAPASAITGITGESLNDLSDVTAANSTTEDGKVLSYNHGAGNFQWVAAPGNTDENVSTANLLAKLALLSNSSPIQIGNAANTTVVIEGNLQVKGSVDTVSETNLEVLDKTVTVAKGSADGIAANGAGLVVDCGNDTNSSLQWSNSGTIGGAGSQRFWSVADSLRIAAPATVVARLEVVGTGDSVLTMTNVLGGSTNVITGGAWTGDNIPDGKIASSGTWNTAAGWGNHGAAGYLTSETSHADVVVDGDFTANGIMERTGAGTYGTLAYLAANMFKGLHTGGGDVGTAGQLLTSEASAGFSWTSVGTGASDVAAGNHLHTGVYAPVAHTHSADDIVGGEVDGGTF